MSSPSLSSRYRTALVTGASTGLGKAFAEMLVAEGVEVWGTARDVARVPDRPGFHGVQLELGDARALEKAFASAEHSAGGFDIVVNNAGFGAFGSFVHTDFAVWEEHYRVMLVNTSLLAQLALRGMLARQRGALVNIASIAGEFSLPYQATYNTIKAGLSAFSESLMYEVKDTGVIVIDFRPGDFKTDFEGSVRRPAQAEALDAGARTRMARTWDRFSAMMQSGPKPEGAAADLKRALWRGRSGTVRTGDVFQAVIAPFVSRLASLRLKRRIQEKYFGL